MIESKGKKEKKRNLTNIFLFGAIIMLGLGLVLLFGAWRFYSFVFGISGIALIISSALLLRGIIRRIPFPQTWVIDRAGTLIPMPPGYHIILTWFGYDKIYKVVKVNIQYSIKLFPDMRLIAIDMKKGGEIRLHDPRIWIKVVDPVIALRTALNFEEQIREIVENRLTGAINQMSYRDIMGVRIPRLLLKKKEKEGVKARLKKKIDEIIKESKSFKDFLEKTKIEFVGFTLDDFDFDKETTKTRRERILTEMRKEITKNKAQARKNELSAIAKTAKELKKAGFSPEEAQKIASERYQDHLVAEQGNLQKIIWQGKGMSIPEIAAQWEFGKTILKKARRKKPKSLKFPSKAQAEKALKKAVKEVLG